MRRATTIAATLAAGLTLAPSLSACDELSRSFEPSATFPSDVADPSDGAASAEAVAPRDGRVLLAIDGDVHQTLVFGVLTEPATYAGGEGALSLVWRTSTYDLFTLQGDVVLGAQPTSTSLRLQLAADLGDGYVAFSSDDGSCTVTVERAERRSLGGEIACTGLTDAGRTLTIGLSGSFEAGGDGA